LVAVCTVLECVHGGVGMPEDNDRTNEREGYARVCGVDCTAKHVWLHRNIAPENLDAISSSYSVRKRFCCSVPELQTELGRPTNNAQRHPDIPFRLFLEMSALNQLTGRCKVARSMKLQCVGAYS
jgi:hypothetical protein